MKLKFRTKILALCIISTLIALIVQTVLFQQASSEIIYNQSKAESYNFMQNIQNEIYTFIKGIENNLIEVYNNRELLEELKAADVGSLQEKYFRQAYYMATENFSTDDSVVALYIYTKNHQLISTYRRAMTPRHNYPKDIYEDSEAFNAARVADYIASEEKQILISSYYNVHRETDIVRFVLKIYDNASTNSITGYLVCDVDTKVLVNIMKKYVTYQEGFIWLRPDGDRNIVSFNRLEETEEAYYRELSEKIAVAVTETEQTFPDKESVLFQVPQNKYNLTAYALMPQSLLKQNQRSLSRTLIMIGLLMCVIIAIVSTFLSRSLTWPLEQLTLIISKIHSGDTSQRVGPVKNDEIGQLGKEFNEMLDEIERLIGQKYQAELSLNKAEYKALQAQINPHFLYNTLDTMSSLASIQNCTVVSNLCQSLSNIFRYSLDIRHPYVTVAKEIMHLNNYIYVMDIRMNNKVKYHFDIDENILQDCIPRISIQPLVENALNHGLKNKKGDKEIVISAKGLGNILEIAVRDNGVGMDADAVNRQLLPDGQNTADSGESIGLRNINARMKILFGTEYGLQVISTLGEGSTVILRVPRKKEDEFTT